MIREDRKAELRMLAFNQGLRHETYYLINKQFEEKLQRQKIFDVKPENYPNVLMTNEPINWEESKNNLKTRLYTQALCRSDTVDDDFCVRYHFNQIRSLNISHPLPEDINSEDKIYFPTDIYGVFRYVINKEKNILSTRVVKIQAGLTIQIEKHSKTL
jgi:hypothetical protein